MSPRLPRPRRPVLDKCARGYKRAMKFNRGRRHVHIQVERTEEEKTGGRREGTDMRRGRRSVVGRAFSRVYQRKRSLQPVEPVYIRKYVKAAEAELLFDVCRNASLVTHCPSRSAYVYFASRTEARLAGKISRYFDYNEATSMRDPLCAPCTAVHQKADGQESQVRCSLRHKSSRCPDALVHFRVQTLGSWAGKSTPKITALVLCEDCQKALPVQHGR